VDEAETAPVVELLKTFEAPIAAVPERPGRATEPAPVPPELLLSVAEEAYRALDA
jgi:hypothetical protein